MIQMSSRKKAKKAKIETKKIHIKLDQLVAENDKYVRDLAEFLQEKMVELTTERDGNNLILTIEQSYSKRKIKEFMKKFLYLADLNNQFRPIALMGGEMGYEIHRRREME